jgi:membrane-associated phospholipid phosphatase
VQSREIFRRVTSIVLPEGWSSVRRSGAVVAVLAGLYLLLAGLVATSVTAGPDADLWAWFDRFDRPGAAHLAIRFVYRFGQFALVLPVVAAVSALTSWRIRSWRPLLVAVGCLGVLDGLMLAFKLPLGRSYPHTGLNTVFGGSGESFQAFPSGHAAHATIGMLLLATLLGRLLPSSAGPDRWGMRPWTVVLAALLAFGAGLANVVQGYHWTTDVVGGWIIGAAMFTVAHALLRQGTPQPDDVIPEAAAADRLAG